MPEETDVLIVGAGPAGSAIALRLARLGYTVRLLDRSIFPRDKACSEYLSPAAVRELAELDVLNHLAADAGHRIEATSVITAQGHRLTGRFGDGQAASGMALARWIMDAALLSAARDAGVIVEQARMQDLLRDGNQVVGVLAHTQTGAAVTWGARVVIGADGLGSLVARRVGARRQGALRRVAFSAHLRGVTGLHSTTEMHVGRDGYIGLNALGDDVSNVTVVVNARRAKLARGDATAFFWQQVRSTEALQSRIVQATMARDVLVTGPFDVTCRRCSGDGFLLVGDAAEFFDPFTGDGIYSALVGARVACDTLALALQTPGPITADRLKPYARARRHAFGGKWLLERLIGYAMLTPRLFHHAVGRIGKRGMADVLIGATGHEVSPWRVLNPVFITRMLL